MDRVQLEVFTFEAGADYLPYYNKLTFPFLDDYRLSDVLAYVKSNIRGFGYDDQNLALRVNGIAVFENLSVVELVQRFSKEWVIEPLSTRYARKDLLIDRQWLLKRYDGFFAQWKFVTLEEREELNKYLLLNLISPIQDDLYLGDGFFLYLQWLISRHPENMREIQEVLCDERIGIWNFVSLADWVYPRAHLLDEGIWTIMNNLAKDSHIALHTLIPYRG